MNGRKIKAVRIFASVVHKIIHGVNVEEEVDK